MQRRRTKMVKLNDVSALEKLSQEVYTDACTLIAETGVVINDLSTKIEPLDADDLAKITKEKINALKVRDSAIKIKLETAKLMNDVIKHKGDELGAINNNLDNNNPNELSDDMLEKLREIAKGK